MQKVRLQTSGAALAPFKIVNSATAPLNQPRTWCTSSQDWSPLTRNHAMRLAVNIIFDKRIYKVGKEEPDDEAPRSFRKYAYADGDLDNPIPADGDDGITGQVVKRPSEGYVRQNPAGQLDAGRVLE